MRRVDVRLVYDGSPSIEEKVCRANLTRPSRRRSKPADGYKVASLLLHSIDIFTYVNEFLAFEGSLVHLAVCKKLRLNWFRYTSVLNVPGKRSFGDNELACFLLNMESFVK